MASKGKSGNMPSKSTVVELEKKYKKYMKDGDIRSFSEYPPDEELIPDAFLIEDSQRDEWDWENREYVDFDGTWVHYIAARKTVGILIPVKLRFDEEKSWDFQEYCEERDLILEHLCCPKCGSKNVEWKYPNELECGRCNKINKGGM